MCCDYACVSPSLYLSIAVFVSTFLNLTVSKCSCVCVCCPMLLIIETSLQKSVSNSILRWFSKQIQLRALFETSSSPYFELTIQLHRFYDKKIEPKLNVIWNIRLQFESATFNSVWNGNVFFSFQKTDVTKFQCTAKYLLFIDWLDIY